MQDLRRKTCLVSSLLLCALLLTLVGCAQPRNVYEIRNTKENIYKGYKGPDLPGKQVAGVIWLPIYRFGILTIDNSEINILNRHNIFESKSLIDSAELIPGKHLFVSACRARKADVTQRFELHAILEGGHVYSLNCDVNDAARSPLNYAVWLKDINTGETIAGRPPVAIDWTWSDFQQILQELKNSRASRQKITELFLTPVWSKTYGAYTYIDQISSGILDKDQTMIYRVCPTMSGVIADFYRNPNKQQGLVFLELDDSDHLDNDYYFDIPDRNCPNLSLPPAWYSKANLIEQQACKFFSYALTIATYLVTTGRHYDSYLAIERAIYIRTTLADNQLELSPDFFNVSNHPQEKPPLEEVQNARQKALIQFIQEAKAFFERNPAVIEAAKELFKEDQLKKLQQKQSDGFMESIHKSLIIYGKLVSPEAFTEAQENLLHFMNEQTH